MLSDSAGASSAATPLILYLLYGSITLLMVLVLLGALRRGATAVAVVAVAFLAADVVGVILVRRRWLN